VQLLGNGLVGTNMHCSICDFVVHKKNADLKE